MAVANTKPSRLHSGIPDLHIHLYAGGLSLEEDLAPRAEEDIALTISRGDFTRSIYFLKSAERLRIALVSLQTSGDGKAAVETRLLSSGRISEVMAAFHRKAVECGCILRGGVFEIRAEEPDEEPDGPGLLHAVTAGLPAAVLIRGGEFLFPLRAGIPGGIVTDWAAQSQSLEYQKGDSLYLFTDSQEEAFLGNMHEHLKQHEGGSLRLPDDMVLLQLDFE